MKPTLLAIRSVGAEFANRIFVIVAITAFLASACLVGLGWWLTTFSDWWWLLFVLIVIIISVVFGVLVIVKLIIRSVAPGLSRSQKKQTRAFVDKLQRLSEVSQTPKFLLLFQVVRDIAAPRENGLIASISNDTSSLKHDFAELIRTFK